MKYQCMQDISRRLGETLKMRGLTVTTAESCTGGWIAKVITDIPGSSAWFDRSFVTYSNAAKQELLGVSSTSLENLGAVSEMVVKEMALGALERAQADFALSVSGIAGPGVGSNDLPVGTVWFGFAATAKAAGRPDKGHFVVAKSRLFDGDRENVRYQATLWALKTLVEDFLLTPLDTV